MKHKILIYCFSILLMLLSASFEQVFACSCVADTSPCQRFGYSDAIFVGKVIGIEKEKPVNENGIDFATKESTIFEIGEVISGAKSKQIAIANKEGSSCDISFMQGETYLIFANGNTKQGFRTGYCSGNLPINQAGETLTALRNLPSAGAGGKLYGEIYEKLKKRDAEFAMMSGVDIKIQEVGGGRKIYNAVSDDKGNYELIVPQGKYKVTPTIPTYAVLGLFSEDPIFVKDRGCAEKSFSIENNAQITGRVVDSRGKPVAKIYLELVSIDGEKPEPFSEDGVHTDKQGNFIIYNVPAGRYTLSVNYLTEPEEEYPFPTIFYPNATEREKAKVLEVGFGELINKLVFRLTPRIIKQRIYGTVVFPNGVPVSEITVNLQRDHTDTTFSYVKTDKNGNFVLNGFVGNKYNFGIDYYGNDKEKDLWTIKKSIFTLEKNATPFRLALERKPEEDSH